MPDIGVRNFAGSINSPNPFWLASAPPTNTGEMIMRAFDAGWGGAVWKTIGEPITNVSSRYSAMDLNGQRVVGLNNIELISDRPVEQNLREMAEVKKRYPKNAVIASLMVASTREAWHEIVTRTEDAGADGLELNFGCPHGMSERGMGSAVGQVPEYAEMITAWVKEKARTPVLVKLTPNISDIRTVARAAKGGGADGLSAINTINSITGIDLDTFVPRPNVDGKSSHGGYCGPAVKPIALNMVQQILADAESALPLSGIGGIGSWRDAAEFLLLGCGTLQVCTAVMHYGYRIVEDMAEGLDNWMREKGFATLEDFRGLSLNRVTEWKHLNLNYKIVARIDEQKCIGCDLCHIACWDGAHQCIHLDRVTGPVDGHVELHRTPAEEEAESRASIAETPVTRKERAAAFAPGPYPTPLERIPRVDETECVGCNLCSLVCPVDGCITMVEVDTGLKPETWEERTREGLALQPQFRLRDYEMSDDISKNSSTCSILDGLNIRDLGDWEIFVQRLEAFVSSGRLRGVPPPQGQLPSYGDRWYLEEGTGDVYFYREPGERNSAEWKRVDPFAPPEPEPPDNNALKLDLTRIPVGRMRRSDAVSLLTRLYILVGFGRVQEVSRPVPSAIGDPSESWFRDPQTGTVYRLVEGNGENDSLWERVPLNEFHAKIQ